MFEANRLRGHIIALRRAGPAILYSQCPASRDSARAISAICADLGVPNAVSGPAAARVRERSHFPVVQHVTREIRASELKRCIRFYETLGFVEVPVPGGIAGRARWLERSGTQIHLMPTADAAPASGHVGVIVEQYADTVARLREAGHEVEPRREHWGAPRSYVRDPAGNLVELMAWAPGGSGQEGETK